MSLWVAASILLSASTYLFDFGSNLLVAVQYARRYVRYLGLEHKQGACDDLCRNQTSELAGYFWAMVAILVFSHTLNALIFRFKFDKEDGPFRSAYFLPLIHLWRLLNLVWRTMHCSGVQGLISQDMSGLFSILGTSLEGMPILILQFAGFIVLAKTGVLPNMSILFKVSVAASLLSAGYNGGSSVHSVAENAKTLKSKIQIAASSGLFTVFASLARCLTYTNIIIRVRQYFELDRTLRSRARYHTTDAIPIIFLGTNIIVYWLYYWLLQNPQDMLKLEVHRNIKKSLTCFVFGYMSIIVGPLYPMVSEGRDRDELGRFVFEMRLFIVAIVNISIDMIVVLVTYMLGTLPLAYAVTSLIAAFGYLVSLVWYISIDRLCGPVLQNVISANEVDSKNVSTGRQCMYVDGVIGSVNTSFKSTGSSFGIEDSWIQEAETLQAADSDSFHSA